MFDSDRKPLLISVVTLAIVSITLLFLLLSANSRGYIDDEGYSNYLPISPLCRHAFNGINDGKYDKRVFEKSLVELIHKSDLKDIFNIKNAITYLSHHVTKSKCIVIFKDGDELRSFHFTFYEDESSYFGQLITKIEEKEV